MTVTHTPPCALVAERRIAGVGGWSDASSALAICAA